MVGRCIRQFHGWCKYSDGSVRKRLGLPVEAAQSLRVRGETIGKEFQGNEAVEFDVFRLIHHAHATASELLQNAIVGNGSASMA